MLSTLESIDRTKAAVFPVPLWLCAIIFCGGSASRVGRAVSWNSQVVTLNYRTSHSWTGIKKSAYLDLAWRIESHAVNTFQKTRPQVQGFKCLDRVEGRLGASPLYLEVILNLDKTLSDDLIIQND